MQIQSKADSEDGKGIMLMVMMAVIIVLVTVFIVLEALGQVDSVHQHVGQTRHKLTDCHW